MGGIWSLVFRRVLISFSFHQHSQLSCRSDGLPLPVVVHVDQRQGGLSVQLVDLGQSRGESKSQMPFALTARQVLDSTLYRSPAQVGVWGQSPIASYSNLNRRTPMMEKATAKASKTPHGNNTPENPMPRTITF
jgi:hypothetical protein